MNDKRAQLTKKASAAYIKSGGNHCPFCKSADIKIDRLETNLGNATANCKCFICHEEWVELYKLVGVEQAEELSR